MYSAVGCTKQFMVKLVLFFTCFVMPFHHSNGFLVDCNDVAKYMDTNYVKHMLLPPDQAACMYTCVHTPTLDHPYSQFLSILYGSKFYARG